MTREEEFGGILLLEDVHACKSACWLNYSDGRVEFCKAILMCVTSWKEKESYYDTKIKTRSDRSGSVKRIKNRELFIFLPWKEKTREAARRSPDVREYISLCSVVGWGPSQRDPQDIVSSLEFCLGKLLSQFLSLVVSVWKSRIDTKACVCLIIVRWVGYTSINSQITFHVKVGYFFI